MSTVPGRRPPSECSPGTRSCQGGNLIKFDLIDALEIMITRTNYKQELQSKSRILLSVERLSLGMRAWVETVRATCKASATAHSLIQLLRWLNISWLYVESYRFHSHSPFFKVLTGREMLTLFARIRGLRSSENLINSELEKLASFVDLTQYLDRPCGQYSGGNKRKLNVALALIGR